MFEGLDSHLSALWLLLVAVPVSGVLGTLSLEATSEGPRPPDYSS